MDFLQNPFHILNASPRDDRGRIMQLAEEQCLIIDSNECAEARSILTNPRKRISAEVAWLIGLSPQRGETMLSILESSPMDLLNVESLAPIVRSNLLAAGLARLPEHNPKEVAKWITELAWAFEDIDPEQLRSTINIERGYSGFSAVSGLSFIESEIQERRLHYRKVIKSALNHLFSSDIVKTITSIVVSATDNGKKHGPVLISDLVDFYEVEAQGFLEKEEENIKTLVEKIQKTADAKQPDSTLAPMVNQLIEVVKNWDIVAQPIQLDAKSRGLDHDASQRVAGLVRALGIHMFNEHGKLDFSQQLTNMLQKVFAEVAEVAEQTAKDADALGEIDEQRKLSLLLNPISDLCKTAIENSKKHPASCDKEAQKIINTAGQLIANLSASKPGSEILSQGKDEIALTLMCSAVAYGNETKNWKTCIAFLEEAFKYANSQEVKSKIQKNLSTVRDNYRLYGGLTPISSAPSLRTVNGIGATMYGSTDHDLGSGSYLSTYYLVFLGIPIFPISRYRVIPDGYGYRFLGKAPLRTFDKWHIAISLGLIAWMIISMW